MSPRGQEDVDPLEQRGLHDRQLVMTRKRWQESPRGQGDVDPPEQRGAKAGFLATRLRPQFVPQAAVCAADRSLCARPQPGFKVSYLIPDMPLVWLKLK